MTNLHTSAPGSEALEPKPLRREFLIYVETEVLRINQMDMCQVLGMPYFAYQKSTTREPMFFETVATRSILARVLAQHPTLTPLPLPLHPMEVFEQVQRILPDLQLTNSEFAACLGLESTSVFRYRHESTSQTTSITRRLLQIMWAKLTDRSQTEEDKTLFMNMMLELAIAEGEARGVSESALRQRGFLTATKRTGGTKGSVNKAVDPGKLSPFWGSLEQYRKAGKSAEDLRRDGLVAARSPLLLRHQFMTYVQEQVLKLTETQMAYLVQLPYMRYQTATSERTVPEKGAGAHIAVPARAILCRLLTVDPTADPIRRPVSAHEFLDIVHRVPGLGSFELPDFATMLGVDISTVRRYLTNQVTSPSGSIQQLMVVIQRGLEDPTYGDGPKAFVEDILKLARIEGKARGISIDTMKKSGFRQGSIPENAGERVPAQRYFRKSRSA